MDLETQEILLDLGIDPKTVPDGTVKLLEAADYRFLSERAVSWAKSPFNQKALAYEIETEHKRHAGIVLRNLYKEKEHKAHLTIVPEGQEGPFWHNWTPALDQIWETGIATLVEGPKDARMLHSLGIHALAYLGQAPSAAHLKTLVRYAHTILWIPDNESLTPETEKRRKLVELIAAKIGLRLRKFKRPNKDAGDLIKDPKQIPILIKDWKETVNLSQGGFRKA